MSSIKHTGLSILIILALMVSMLAALVTTSPVHAAVTPLVTSPTAGSPAIVKPTGTVTVSFVMGSTDNATYACQAFMYQGTTSYNSVGANILDDGGTKTQTINVPTGAPAGLYNVYVTVGTTNSPTITGAVYVDNVAPVGSLITFTGGGCYKPTTPTYPLQYSFSDNCPYAVNSTVLAEYSSNGGGSWAAIATFPKSQVPGTYSYDWAIPAGSDSSTWKVRLTVTDYAGNISTPVQSGTNFTVTSGTGLAVTVTSPVGGEVWNGGSSQNITFTMSSTSSATLDYMIELYNGTAWVSVTPSWVTAQPIGDIVYPWTVASNVKSSACRIRVTVRDCAANTTTGTSASTFRIVDVVAPTVTVNIPTTGLTWYAGSTDNITWAQTDNVAGDLASVLLYYTTNGGTNWFLIGSGVVTQGANKYYSWTIPTGLSSTNCKIKVVATDSETPGNVGTGYSGTFTIASSSTVASVIVCSPNGGESYQAGSVQAITWTASDSPDATARMIYTIKLSTDGGGTWPTTVATLSNQSQCSSCTCSYSWAVPDSATSLAMIQITATDPAGNSAVDTSDSVFTITAAACAVETGTVALSQGWNLISLPINPTNTNINSILSGIMPSVISVWLYDSVCPSTTASWYSYAPGAPSTLLTMEAGKAYWVNMAAPASLTFQGRKCPCPPSSPTTFTICRTGWNMIGFKSTLPKSVSTYFTSLGTCGTGYLAPINGYASGAWTTVNCSDNMTPGKGYWVYINTTGLITPGCE